MNLQKHIIPIIDDDISYCVQIRLDSFNVFHKFECVCLSWTKQSKKHWAHVNKLISTSLILSSLRIELIEICSFKFRIQDEFIQYTTWKKTWNNTKIYAKLIRVKMKLIWENQFMKLYINRADDSVLQEHNVIV